MRYEFRNAELLRQALTHRSHSATHNERLEFLGDSVLNCAVAALLFQRFSKLDEGDLSRVRANLVKQQSLYEIAQALNIADGLRLGEGELRSGGFRRPSILADALEAIFGAIFLDGGFDAAQTVIKRLYVPILDHIDPRTLGKDSKTLLQEYLQGHKIALPTYTVVATHGAAHNQQFEVECTVPKLDVKVSGSGASRRAAEQAAAKKALDEVMAAAPALAAKPRRSKGARAPKLEPEVVPGVTGVQGALDLRTPERRERAARGEARAERPVLHATSAPAAADEGAERAQAAPPAAAQGGQQAAAHAAQAAAPLAVIRAAHVERPAEKDKSASVDGVPSAASIGHRSGAPRSEAPLRAVERAEVAAGERAPQRHRDTAAEARDSRETREARDTHERADRGEARHETRTEGDADAGAAIPVRAADAGH